MNMPSAGFRENRLFQPEEASLLEGLELFRLRGEPCPYFADGRVRESVNFMLREAEPGVYEGLLAYGWRRCGCLFYKSVCPACAECRPLRVDAALFKPGRSQRRCSAVNASMLISVGEPADSDEDFELFSRYCAARHDEKAQSREEFRLFLSAPPVESVAIRHRLPSGRLVCVAWTDLLPSSLSAVYTAFDPDFPKLGLGVFSILTQLELCRRLNRRHLHLGFRIAGCRKMSYKNLYKPCQSPDSEGRWRGVPLEA